MGELDDVTNVHKRWSLTRINFSSHKISIAVSIIFSIIIIITFHIYFINSVFEEILIHLISGVLILLLSDFVDYFLLKGNPINKLSKIFHLSAFSMILWFSVIIFGALSDIIFSKSPPVHAYMLEGFFLAVGLRIGLFCSVFGVKLWKAMLISFVQPALFFIFSIPSQYYFEIVTNQFGLIFGTVITIIGVIWAVRTDRIGRPNVHSTFGLLQAFLDAWTEKKNYKIEKIFESRSSHSEIETRVIKFKRNSDNVFLVLPEIHPGPFMYVGGSNISFRLYEFFSNKAMIFHSISDHSLNIPSGTEVDKYIDSMQLPDIKYEGYTCTNPVQIVVGNVTVTGILFGKTVLMILSNSPKGMEDIPIEIGKEIEKYANELGFDETFLVDSHNSMGDVLVPEDREKMLNSVKKCLELMKNSEQYQFSIGYANSEHLQKLNRYQELGKAGLSVLIIKINEKNFGLGWIDSNNMKNGIREYLINFAKNMGDNILEVCTSDTHETSGKRTGQGYFPFGNSIETKIMEDAYRHMISEAEKDIKKSAFEIIKIKSQIKIMGEDQFSDYSNALDKSMKFTKICLGVTLGFVSIMLYLSR